MRQHHPLVESLEMRRLLAASLLVDLGPGPLHTYPHNLTVFNGGVYFLAGHQRGDGQGSAHWWLWRTDGTAQGTQPVLMGDGLKPGYDRLASTPISLGLYWLVLSGDRLYAFQNVHYSAMIFDLCLHTFASDGSMMRHHIGQMNKSDPGFPRFDGPILVSGQLYFFWPGRYNGATQSWVGRQWYTTSEDGTPVGTGNPNPYAYAGVRPPNLSAIEYNGFKLYRHDDGDHGFEMWIDRPDRIATRRFSSVGVSPAGNTGSFGSKLDETRAALSSDGLLSTSVSFADDEVPYDPLKVRE